jgi:hypothetical protein
MNDVQFSCSILRDKRLLPDKPLDAVIGQDVVDYDHDTESQAQRRTPNVEQCPGGKAEKDNLIDKTNNASYWHRGLPGATGIAWHSECTPQRSGKDRNTQRHYNTEHTFTLS